MKMNIKEFIKQSGKNNKLIASKIGINRFRLTLDKENIKTPHYIMSKVEDMIENRTSVANGLRLLTLFVMPDLKFTSDDEKSSVFANEWLNQRDLLEREIFNFIYLLLGVGNSYMEPQYNKNKLDMIYTFPTPSSIYLNVNRKNENEYWVVEYPTEVFSIQGKVLKFHPVSYVYGSYTWRNNIWGTTMGKEELKQYKLLWSKSPFYGSGLLSSAVDNEDVAEEILKNWSLAAKYRSLSKKIIGFYNQDGESIDPSEIESIRQEMSMLEEEDSLLVNKRFESHDLGFSGADNMMNTELEFLRRDTGGSLTPNYMTPFSQDSSLATASEAKVPFALSINSIQKMIEGFLNNIITKRLREDYPFLSEDLYLSLGEADLYSRNENFMNITQLYNYKAATFNELRKSAGLPTVEGGDVWGKEPPLDKTTTSIKVGERNKTKTLKEKYKKELLQIKSPNIITKDIVLKEGATPNKKVNFKEAVKEMLR
jgi:hypothetical protein